MYTFGATNPDSWVDLTATFPADETAFRQRFILQAVLRALNDPTTAQVVGSDRACGLLHIQRDGANMSPRIPALVYFTGGSAADTELRPIMYWSLPFPFPVRPADVLNTHFPGDADATPAQDWTFEILLGPEI